MKKLYEYDKDTGEFRAETNATPNPRKPGEYLARVNATFTVPPTVSKNEVAVFDVEANKWEVKKDWRKTVYYIRNDEEVIETVTIDKIGDVVPPDSYTALENIPKTQAEKETEIRARRDGLINQADILINKGEDAGNDTTALRQYRQTLRDVPGQPGFPDTIIWPEVPA